MQTLFLAVACCWTFIWVPKLGPFSLDAGYQCSGLVFVLNQFDDTHGSISPNVKFKMSTEVAWIPS